MARRKRGRTRTRYVKKYVKGRASKAGIKGAIRPIGLGVAVGVIQSFVPNDLLGGFADPAIPIGVGYFMNDKTLMTIGGYQLGLKLAGGMVGQGGAGAGMYE